ncbi:hypothetical protein GE21DRAFT_1054917 [Neurospora crassa]|nr:hypothetical protein GE21DRAFT_1054917 [Neurospora crassa]
MLCVQHCSCADAILRPRSKVTKSIVRDSSTSQHQFYPRGLLIVTPGLNWEGRLRGCVSSATSSSVSTLILFILDTTTAFHHLSNKVYWAHKDCKTDGVAPKRLCENCVRVAGKSVIIQRLVVADSYKLRNRRTIPTEKELFFHRPRLENIMESVASGCHLCSIVFWDENRYFRHTDQSELPQRLSRRPCHSQTRHNVFGHSRRLLLSEFHGATLLGRDIIR